MNNYRKYFLSDYVKSECLHTKVKEIIRHINSNDNNFALLMLMNGEMNENSTFAVRSSLWKLSSIFEDAQPQNSA